MAWPDDLYPASFRGVPFEIELASAEFALRHEVHEFPGRDGAVVEDLGRAPDRFRLEGFVVGADWLDRKRRLIEACNRRGSGGTLVHPWYGAVAVFCASCSVRESNRQGEIVRFELEFVRVAGAPQIFDHPQPASDAAEKAAAVGAASESETAKGVVGTGVPDFVRLGTAEALSRIGAHMRGLDILSAPAAEAASLAEETARLVDQASALSTSPVAAAALVHTSIERIFDASANAVAALAAYETFADLEVSQLGGDSALASARDLNVRLVMAQARQTAIAGAVRAAAAIDWPSYEDAIATRARLLELLDAELDAAPPSQYEVLALLRGALVAAVPPPEGDLPRLLRLELANPSSSLELAYALYDDRDRAGEITARNRRPYPGRLAVGSTVEVLSR